jgi:hypothetical protein
MYKKFKEFSFSFVQNYLSRYLLTIKFYLQFSNFNIRN